MQLPSDWRIWLVIAAAVLVAIILLIRARYSVSLGWRGMKAIFSPPARRRLRVGVGRNLAIKNSQTGNIHGIGDAALPERADIDVLSNASISGSNIGDISGVAQSNRVTGKRHG
jgi:hypothetical protein